MTSYSVALAALAALTVVLATGMWEPTGSKATLIQILAPLGTLVFAFRLWRELRS